MSQIVLYFLHITSVLSFYINVVLGTLVTNSDLPPGYVNTLRPRQNGRYFADDTFKRIFLNENVRILIKISLKFVPKGPINNISTLVQIMAWRRSGDKPLSEPIMVSLLTHICVTRPQWVKLPIQNRHLTKPSSAKSRPLPAGLLFICEYKLLHFLF